MTLLDILALLIALTLGTQICRFLPLFLPKHWLTHPMLQKLNTLLPLVIMVLLVLTSVSLPNGEQGDSRFLAQVLALVGVVVSYRRWGNTLLSVALGILLLNLLLWALAG